MVREWLEDHVILTLLVLTLIGVVIGVLGIYLISSLIAFMHLAEWAFAVGGV